MATYYVIMKETCFFVQRCPLKGNTNHFVFTEQRKIKGTLKGRIKETQTNSFHIYTVNDIKVYENSFQLLKM